MAWEISKRLCLKQIPFATVVKVPGSNRRSPMLDTSRLRHLLAERQDKSQLLQSRTKHCRKLA